MYFSLWEVKCKIVWNAPWSAIQIVLKCIIIFSWIHFREKKSKRKQEIICTIETVKSINILKYITLSRKTKWWANHYTNLIIIISTRAMTFVITYRNNEKRFLQLKVLWIIMDIRIDQVPLMAKYTSIIEEIIYFTYRDNYKRNNRIVCLLIIQI